MRALRAATLLLGIGAGLAVAGCPTVDLGDPPVTPPLCRPSFDEFKNNIWMLAIDPPDTTKSCVANEGCHEQATGRSALRLIRAPQTDADWALNLDVVARYLNCSTPAASQLITKPSGIDTHLGGTLWPCDSKASACEPEDTVEKWISAR